MKPDPKPLADAEIAKYLDDLVRFPSMDWSAASAARMLATIVELKIALRGSRLAKASEIESGGALLRDQWHGLFHKLWSNAVGTPGYQKEDWKRLELLHARMASCGRCNHD